MSVFQFSDPDVLDALGEHLALFGDGLRARALLLKSVALAPEGNPMKYFYLGQLSEGLESLQFYRSALNLLSGRVDESVAALVAIAELFMTDLCDQEGAREACQEALNKGRTKSCSSLRLLKRQFR